jgi:beta-glucosidase
MRNMLLASVLAIAFATSAQAKLSEGDIDALIAKMTVEEKLGQLAQRAGGRQRALNSKIDASELDRVRRCEVGSYLHVAGAAETRELQRVAVEECRLHIPLLFAMDVVHGYRTIFPVPIAMAASWDTEVAKQAAHIAAVETSSSGLHWTFAPMIDISRDPRWGRIVEGAGEDAYLGARMAEAQVVGFQGKALTDPGTVMATAKHLGAYGAAEGGRDYGGADISERTLKEVYLAPFHAAADAGAASMMVAFNEIGGLPATGNAALVNGMLRDKWRWSGMTVSDWRSIEELIAHGVAEDRVAAGRLALNAGVDMDMISEIYGPELKGAVAQDSKLAASLDASVRNILNMKNRLGLFDNWKRFHDPVLEKSVLLSPANRAAAREAATRSVVLLKNDGALLPMLAPNKKVALIGALADDARSQLGSWKGRGEEAEVVTLRGALAARLPALTYTPGADTRSSSTDGISAAVAAAKASDMVILTVGEDFDWSGEARSRSDLRLPGAQQALADAVFATGKPVVVVVMTGRPLVLSDLTDKAGAIVLGWYGGNEGGTALADVLLGDANPAGRLPATFPRTTGQVPLTYDMRPSGRPANPDIKIDSNRYQDIAETPLYAFGHGLSYSSFTYGAMTIDRPEIAGDASFTVNVPITNNGARAGDEVVQLYVRDPVASVSRPVKQLRGFSRVNIKPGETRTVSFTLNASQFALYDAQGNWKVEPGTIEIMVGAASDDIRQRGSIRITSVGTAPKTPAAIATVVSVSGGGK